MVNEIKPLVADWKFDAISLGFPSPVRNGKIVSEPKHLGRGWVGFNFKKALGKPVRILNDASMQALPSRLDVPFGQPVIDSGVTYWHFRRQSRFYTFSWPLTTWLAANVSHYDMVHIHALFSYASIPAGVLGQTLWRTVRRATVGSPQSLGNGQLPAWSQEALLQVH